jgi:type II secretory pathway component GspD/PulD (secretin)
MLCLALGSPLASAQRGGRQSAQGNGNQQQTSPPQEQPAPSKGFNEALSIYEQADYYSVAIEALVLEVNKNLARDLGIKYTFNRNEENHPDNILEGADTNLPASFDRVGIPAFSDVGTLGGFAIEQMVRSQGIGTTLQGMDLGRAGRVSAEIRALLQQGVAEIYTRPIAITLNNTTVEINTVDDIPYQDVKWDEKKKTNNLTVSNKKVGVKLMVTPKIISLEEQIIELNLLNIEVSGVSHYVNANRVSLPVFVESSTKTKVRLPHGGALQIGGLITKREVVVESRVPILGRIPILGWLFKSQHKEVQNRDVIFIISPHLLDPGVNCPLPQGFLDRQHDVHEQTQQEIDDLIKSTNSDDRLLKVNDK